MFFSTVHINFLVAQQCLIVFCGYLYRLPFDSVSFVRKSPERTQETKVLHILPFQGFEVIYWEEDTAHLW